MAALYACFDPHVIIFSNRLENEMDKRGLTPQDFEDYDICSASTINGYLNRSHAPNIIIAIDIARFLNVSLDYLFGTGFYLDAQEETLPDPREERKAPWLR